MLLLGRQAYWMNDSLEKMYPLMKSIKIAAIRDIERVRYEEILGSILHPLRMRDRLPKITMQFIRPIDGPRVVVLEVGDYAIIRRGMEVKRI
jgi:hypothetical protein